MQKIFKEIEEKTKNNTLLKLNVCIGYNFTEELHHVRTSINDKAEKQNYFINLKKNQIKEI